MNRSERMKVRYMKTKMILLAFVFLGLVSKAQQGITSFKVITNPENTPTITGAMSAAEIEAAKDAINQSVVFSIDLEDAGSAKIYVRLGSDSTAFDKYNQVLNINGTNLPQGTTLTKNGSSLNISLGSFLAMTHYYAEIEVESVGGVKSRKYQIIQ